MVIPQYNDDLKDPVSSHSALLDQGTDSWKGRACVVSHHQDSLVRWLILALNAMMCMPIKAFDSVKATLNFFLEVASSGFG